MNARLLRATLVVVWLVGAVCATAGVIRVDLPDDPDAWINSGPLTSATLEGKGAFFWFFEESAPECRAKWPALLALAKSYEGQPIVFVGVNSGNPRPLVEQYAKQCKVDWPILVDPTRQLETQFEVGMLGPHNIFQVRVLTPEGKFLRVNWDDLPGAAKLAVEGAKWKTDLAAVPEALRPAYAAVEVCRYPVAGPIVKRGLASDDPATKEAASKLQEIVQAKIAAAVNEAKATAEQGDKYAAQQRYAQIVNLFDGFELPPEVVKQRQDLLRDPQVKGATKAIKDIDTVRRLLASNATPASRNRAAAMLKQAAKDAAGTQIGKEAEDLLTQMGAEGQ